MISHRSPILIWQNRYTRAILSAMPISVGILSLAIMAPTIMVSTIQYSDVAPYSSLIAFLILILTWSPTFKYAQTPKHWSLQRLSFFALTANPRQFFQIFLLFYSQDFWCRYISLKSPPYNLNALSSCIIHLHFHYQKQEKNLTFSELIQEQLEDS